MISLLIISVVLFTLSALFFGLVCVSWGTGGCLTKAGAGALTTTSLLGGISLALWIIFG